MSRLLTALVLGVSLLTTARAAALHRDVEYGRANGVRLLCDVSVPDGTGPFPVAILVHGGGWRTGDKGGTDKPGSSADISPWFAEFTAGNFAWFSINYRTSATHRWPACLEDVQTAIRWVKAHAAEYHGDPARIVLVGHSAGGHLVCLAATLAGEDTRVQAVAGFAAVTDLVADSNRRGGLSESLQKLFGLPKDLTSSTLELLRERSPIDHVHPGLPPFLLLQGDADKTVPPAFSVAFQTRVHAVGGTCDLITIPGAPHGLMTWSKLAPDYPRRMIEWLHHALGEPSPGQRQGAARATTNDGIRRTL